MAEAVALRGVSMLQAITQGDAVDQWCGACMPGGGA